MSEEKTHKVAALYVETDGVYFGLPEVDPWDEKRDARGYAGPHPVVAHPPCNKWSPLAYINQRRIPGYKLGDDGGRFEAALNAVRTYGGVLEHPASSVAWKHYGLMKPERGFWKGTFGEWVTEVDQGSYGHRARKRTWLYATGMPNVPPALDWGVAESDAIVSGFTHQPKGAHVACEHRRIRPQEASRTPIAFRDLLVGIAFSVHSSEDRCERLLSGRDPHQPMNPFVVEEQGWVERFVKAEYWQLRKDGRFAFTRAPLTRNVT